MVANLDKGKVGCLGHYLAEEKAELMEKWKVSNLAV
jgi:hypothetical protein